MSEVDQELKQRILDLLDGAKRAARRMQTIDVTTKDAALTAMAAALRANANRILDANAADLDEARNAGRNEAFLDRLRLDPGRIEGMAGSLEEVAALPDPSGEVLNMKTRPNGLQIGKVRVPIGVVAIIYEARPNVTSEAASLCLKSGNVCVLKGGSDSLRSNKAIVEVLEEAGTGAGLPAGAVTFINEASREAVDILLVQDELVDLVVPRGGEGLIRTVVTKSRIPVVKQYKGVCHTFVDEGADHDMAAAIAVNAKVQRPSVCNSMETLLVHKAEAETFLPRVAKDLIDQGVTLRGCPASQALVPEVEAATDEDWGTEYLDLILSVRVVDDLPTAVEHIADHGSGHSEAIITQDVRRARQFLAMVDAAAVYVNASTRFTDGQQFGLGAEIGISTGKIHSRGPMGLEELTTIKYIVWGDGHVRPDS